MSYVYEEQKSQLFTDEGQRTFLAIRDHTEKLLKESGAVRLQEMIRVGGGSSWLLIACVDRLIELGEIREIPQNRDEIVGQHRIFVSTHNG